MVDDRVMNVSDFIAAVEDRGAPVSAAQLADFERDLGVSLPPEYRDFLAACNGGYVGGALWFTGPTPSGDDADAGVHHIGGLRKESYFSLPNANDIYRGRIHDTLLWVMDDPFGNAICLGVRGAEVGRVYFWDHENEPDDLWDGRIETAGNLTLLANSFTDFIAGLHPNEDGGEGEQEESV